MEIEKQILQRLLAIPTLSGFECDYAPEIKRALSSWFSDIEIDNAGNILIRKKANKEGAARLLIDAHIDQIGFTVSEILDGGFIRVVGIGGVDARTLPAADVIIYGKTPIRGVIASTPPHLSEREGKLSRASEILIDTGLPYEELKEAVEIGAAAVYADTLGEMGRDTVCSPALDNKSCAAAALAALYNAKCEYDTTVLLCAREESGGFVGARVGIAKEMPTAAIVCDVNFAYAPKVEKRESAKRGAGPSISVSALTDRALTNDIIALAKKKGIPLQTVVEASDLGSDGNISAIMGDGVRCAALSLPLTNMHSANETVSLSDLSHLAELLSEIMSGGALI